MSTRVRSARRWRARTIGGVCVALFGATEGAAQSPILLQGIVDAEVWATDTNSNLLSRNGGRTAVLGRAMLWSAIEPRRGFVLYALAEAEQSSGVDAEIEVEQLAVRTTLSRKFVIDAGKITGMIGTFAARRFSDRNPLIMAPDGYPVHYPLGAQVSGVLRMFDYRAGVVSLPEYHEGYTPEPSPAFRPAIGVGITPYFGVRLGASYTEGPYLRDDMSSTQLANSHWRSYKQRVTAADLAASIGYFELRAEAGIASYDVPNRAEPIEGLQYYVEGKYTLSPRVFIATRFQRNDYPFIGWVETGPGTGFWVARKTDFHDEEFGIGYRLTKTTLIKASYHQDLWHVNASNQQFVRPGGKAFAAQLSQSFDLLNLIR
jgi:hypothetical protein